MTPVSPCLPVVQPPLRASSGRDAAAARADTTYTKTAAAVIVPVALASPTVLMCEREETTERLSVDVDPCVQCPRWDSVVTFPPTIAGASSSSATAYCSSGSYNCTIVSDEFEQFGGHSVVSKRVEQHQVQLQQLQQQRQPSLPVHGWHHLLRQHRLCSAAQAPRASREALPYLPC